MAFTIFVNSTTGDADEVNDNYYHVGSGNLLPMAASATMANTTSVNDLGNTTNKWNIVYVDGVGALPVVKKIYSTTLTAGASDITVSGLNGDVAKQYDMMLYVPVISQTTKYSLVINGDSNSANYYSCTCYCFNAAIVGGTSSSYYLSSPTSTGIVFFANDVTVTSTRFRVYMRLSAKTNTQRSLFCQGGFINSNTSLWRIDAGTPNIYEPTQTITSIKIYDAGGANLPTNTYFIMWATYDI